MTREEAFKNLVALNAVCGQKDFFDKEFEEALLVAEKALEQQPCEDATLKDIFCMGCEYKEQEPCPYWDYGLNTCRHSNIGALATVTPNDVLEKIRAEIEKAVWEDVVVSLDGMDEVRIPRLNPDDVFEIIDKYKDKGVKE